MRQVHGRDQAEGEPQVVHGLPDGALLLSGAPEGALEGPQGLLQGQKVSRAWGGGSGLDDVALV